MSDKDLLVVISEMLRKQDQQAEKLDEHSAILNRHTEILNEHSTLLERQIDLSNKQIDTINRQTVDINNLKDVVQQFVDISILHFQKQEVFNTSFLSKLDEIAKKP